jgi:hypothetical protein
MDILHQGKVLYSIPKIHRSYYLYREYGLDQRYRLEKNIELLGDLPTAIYGPKFGGNPLMLYLCYHSPKTDCPSYYYIWNEPVYESPERFLNRILSVIES